MECLWSILKPPPHLHSLFKYILQLVADAHKEAQAWQATFDNEVATSNEDIQSKFGTKMAAAQAEVARIISLVEQRRVQVLGQAEKQHADKVNDLRAQLRAAQDSIKAKIIVLEKEYMVKLEAKKALLRKKKHVLEEMEDLKNKSSVYSMVSEVFADSGLDSHVDVSLAQVRGDVGVPDGLVLDQLVRDNNLDDLTTIFYMLNQKGFINNQEAKKHFSELLPSDFDKAGLGRGTTMKDAMIVRCGASAEELKKRLALLLGLLSN